MTEQMSIYCLSTMGSHDMLVLFLSGKGSQLCLERSRGPGLLAANPCLFFIISGPRVLALLCYDAYGCGCNFVAKKVKVGLSGVVLIVNKDSVSQAYFDIFWSFLTLETHTYRALWPMVELNL